MKRKKIKPTKSLLSAERRITRQLILDLGGPTKVAELLGGTITRQAVSLWSRVPPKHVLKIADLTKKPPRAIRPDLYR